MSTLFSVSGLLAVMLTGLTGAEVGQARDVSTTHHVRVVPARPSARLGPLPTISQSLNNCGPAAIAEVLAYWGIARSQYQVQAAVRADGSVYGMAPFGVPAYARSVGLDALIGADGSERAIKILVSNGFPVIVSQWVSPWDHIRHYRPIEAYDDRSGIFVSSDPYLGPNHPITYADFARIWTVSDGRFIVLYPRSRAPLLAAALAAAGWREKDAYRHDLLWQQARLRDHTQDVPGSPMRYYGYPSLAWDQMELGNFTAARLALREAARRGANPIVIGWVAAEIQRRQPAHAGRKGALLRTSF